LGKLLSKEQQRQEIVCKMPLSRLKIWAKIWAIFQKNWAIFFSNHLVTLSEISVTKNGDKCFFLLSLFFFCRNPSGTPEKETKVGIEMSSRMKKCRVAMFGLRPVAQT
jgi:hypothetical protein